MKKKIEPGLVLFNHDLGSGDDLYEISIEEYGKWTLSKLRKFGDTNAEFLEEAIFVLQCLNVNEIYPGV